MSVTLTDEVRAFLSGGTRTGKLAWVAAGGRALVAPIWFVVEGDALLFTTHSESSKGKAIARDPRLAVSVDLEEPPYGFVQVQGVAEVTTDADELLRVATRCGVRYMGVERAEEFGARNAAADELLVRLRPTKIVADLDVTAYD